MDPNVIIAFFIVLIGAVFMYFVGIVIVQALKLSIIQHKSDVQIKMDKHMQEQEQRRLHIESKRLALEGSTEKVKKEKPAPEIKTIEITIEGKQEGLKEALENIGSIRKFVIMGKNVLLDVEGDLSADQLTKEIEEKAGVHIKDLHIAKNPKKTEVKGK